MLTEELLRDYLERFMTHVEVDEVGGDGVAQDQRLPTNLSPNSAPMQPIYNVDHNY